MAMTTLWVWGNSLYVPRKGQDWLVAPFSNWESLLEHIGKSVPRGSRLTLVWESAQSEAELVESPAEARLNYSAFLRELEDRSEDAQTQEAFWISTSKAGEPWRAWSYQVHEPSFPLLRELMELRYGILLVQIVPWAFLALERPEAQSGANVWLWRGPDRVVAFGVTLERQLFRLAWPREADLAQIAEGLRGVGVAFSMAAGRSATVRCYLAGRSSEESSDDELVRRLRQFNRVNVYSQVDLGRRSKVFSGPKANLLPPTQQKQRVSRVAWMTWWGLVGLTFVGSFVALLAAAQQQSTLKEVRRETARLKEVRQRQQRAWQELGHLRLLYGDDSRVSGSRVVPFFQLWSEALPPEVMVRRMEWKSSGYATVEAEAQAGVVGDRAVREWRAFLAQRIGEVGEGETPWVWQRKGPSYEHVAGKL